MMFNEQQNHIDLSTVAVPPGYKLSMEGDQVVIDQGKNLIPSIDGDLIRIQGISFDSHGLLVAPLAWLPQIKDAFSKYSRNMHETARPTQSVQNPPAAG